MGYPYRSSEILELNVPLPTDPTFKILREVESDLAYRPPTSLSLGCHVLGAALPHPDPQDSKTMMDGIKKRFACEMPEPDVELWKEFEEFVDAWLEANLTPIPADADTSVKTWLEKCPYALSRKSELKQKNEAILDVFDPRHAKVKSFQKDETYLEYKHARAINSRTDEFKTLSGPIFKLVDEVLFSRSEFIKKIPKHERPSWLLEELLVEGAQYAATDFSVFEAHFRDLQFGIEFRLYRYLTKHLPDSVWWVPLVEKALSGINICQFKWCTISVRGRRMSGEMCTSSGNGFFNLMCALFMHKKKGNTQVKVKVEGDDSIQRFFGEFPDSDLIKRMGLRLKLEVVDDITSASFCGMVFDSTDRTVVTEPVSELVGFGWTNQRYINSSYKRRMELLRAKSMSMCYEYAGCPILNALGKYGIRMTHGYRARAPLMNNYDQEFYNSAMQYIKQKGVPDKEPGLNTRSLVERLYGIPVKTQIEYELYLDSLTTLEPLVMGPLEPFVSKVWRDYYENYVVCGTRSPFIFPEKFVRTPL